ncbi:O-antigen ligase family protein [Candidatus Omnitrophota bacterium]
MGKFVLVCLLVIPWIICPLENITDAFRSPKEMFFDMMCLGMIILALKDGIPSKYRNKFLALLAAWVGITVFFNWHAKIVLSFKGNVIVNFWTLTFTLHFFLGLAATIIAIASLRKADFERIAKALCLSSVIVTLWGTMQTLGFDPLGKLVVRYCSGAGDRFYACMDNPNIVGNYLALCLPFFLCFLDKWKFRAGGIIVLLGLLLTKAFGAMVCGIFGIWLFLLLSYRGNKKIRNALCVAMVGMVVIAGSVLAMKLDSGLSNRLPVWKMTMEHLRDNPLYGQGLGIFQTWNIDYPAGTRWLTAHNDWLERTCEIGVLGIILFLLVIVNSFRNFDYSVKNRFGIAYCASFCVFLLLMGGSFVMETAETALLGLVGFWAMETYTRKK